MEPAWKARKSGEHHGYFAALSGLELEAFIEVVRLGYADAVSEGHLGSETARQRFGLDGKRG